jgi:tetratricopeptide (TPR) repeat protein
LDHDSEAPNARLKLADALIKQVCYQEAVSVLEAGRPSHPHSTQLQSQLRDARSLMSEQHYFAGLGSAEESAKRERNLLRCKQLADVNACQSALLSSATDSFQIYKRKAILLQSVDRSEQALDSYIAANALKQTDKSVALAIVALTQNTGRKDAVALSALGSAVLALGRAPEAVLVLRQTQSLSPALPGIASLLASAERLARLQTRASVRRPRIEPSATESSAPT